MENILLFLIAGISAVVLVLIIIAVLMIRNSLNRNDAALKGEYDQKFESMSKELRDIKFELDNEIKSSRAETNQAMQASFKLFGELLNTTQKDSADNQDKRLQEMQRQLSNMNVENEQRLENIRKTMESRINALTEDNNKQLEKMRDTVDEKLQKTLEDRITQSFNLVSERLEAVYKGLGEMQNLASGVGDLKKVLSNVKTRGILGEIQLSAILEQILTQEQYDENVATKKGSSDRVEFAIRLPGNDEGIVYLPIDAKFPADSYSKLMDAYEEGDREAVKAAEKVLIQTIKNEAKDIRDKYIYPPDTTDFAIMFLPVEGLYAEVVRLGLIETLQREYRVNIAGPTTMAALLNSLQMGFKTLAIQKHSSEVWQVLGAVKTEFDKFGTVLAKTQERINQANKELDTLIGTRTNVIKQKLKNVQSLPEHESRSILEIPEMVMLDDDNDID
ncbi:MAG: DNA recombination protein RmuC [Clostridiales bacterium]|nr:DNA recombination protein RmuC [Clostridiales bacterium]